MATRVIKVSGLSKGQSYHVPGTLGDHCLCYMPNTHKVYGFNKGILMCSLEVEKDDILIYNCGNIKVMAPWRKRVYSLLGYMPIIVSKDIPETHDEGISCTWSHRSASGDFYRRVTKDICLVITGRPKELFSYDTGYCSRIIARSPEALLKWLGKSKNVNFCKRRYVNIYLDFKGLYKE